MIKAAFLRKQEVLPRAQRRTGLTWRRRHVTDPLKQKNPLQQEWVSLGPAIDSMVKSISSEIKQS